MKTIILEMRGDSLDYSGDYFGPPGDGKILHLGRCLCLNKVEEFFRVRSPKILVEASKRVFKGSKRFEIIEFGDSFYYWNGDWSYLYSGFQDFLGEPGIWHIRITESS